jgi:hypothetical protein
LSSEFSLDIHTSNLKFIELAGWKPGPDTKDGKKSWR